MFVVLSSLLKYHHYLTLFFNAFRVFLDTYCSISFILDLTLMDITLNGMSEKNLFEENYVVIPPGYWK